VLLSFAHSLPTDLGQTEPCFLPVQKLPLTACISELCCPFGTTMLKGRSLRPLFGEPQSFAHREVESFAEVPQPVAEPVPVGAAG